MSVKGQEKYTTVHLLGPQVRRYLTFVILSLPPLHLSTVVMVDQVSVRVSVGNESYCRHLVILRQRAYGYLCCLSPDTRLIRADHGILTMIPRHLAN